MYRLFGDEGEQTISGSRFEQLIDNVRMEKHPKTIEEPVRLLNDLGYACDVADIESKDGGLSVEF